MNLISGYPSVSGSNPQTLGLAAITGLVMTLSVPVAAAPTDAIIAPESNQHMQLPSYMEPHKAPLPLPDLDSPSADETRIVIGPILAGAVARDEMGQSPCLDADFSETITLPDALRYALLNNLSIKISKESWIYQRYQLLSNMGLFLPTNAMNWNLVRSSVTPQQTVSRSRVYTETVRFPVFQGGSVFYNALAQYYREKGWNKAFATTINDALLNVYRDYSNLQYNRALLRIRTMSVKVSQAQLELNDKLYTSGKGTRFAIMQSKAQLESDQQDLLEQQVAFRTAALNLAFDLNYPTAVNLIPAERVVSQVSLIDKSCNNADALIALAVEHRPELRQYELFRLAANRTVQAAAAPLYPSMTLFPSYTRSSTSVTSAAQASNVAGAGVFGGLFNTVQQGMVAAQTLSGMGVPAAMNIAAAQALSRQALVQANQELMTVIKQVRVDYLNLMTASKKIRVASVHERAAKEALRMAQVRLKSGVGTNLELIEAQRDYVSATISHVKAIVDSNQAQAQLLHDTGTISVESLTADHG